MVIRRAGPADVAAWARLRLAMLAEVDPHDPITADEDLVTGWLRARLDAPDFGAFVAEVDGEIVASGGVTIYDVPPGPTRWAREAYVMSMYTVPEHRGRGIAREVLDALIAFATGAGDVGRVWLRASDAGRAVYLRADFEPRDYYLQRYL